MLKTRFIEHHYGKVIKLLNGEEFDEVLKMIEEMTMERKRYKNMGVMKIMKLRRHN